MHTGIIKLLKISLICIYVSILVGHVLPLCRNWKLWPATSNEETSAMRHVYQPVYLVQVNQKSICQKDPKSDFSISMNKLEDANQIRGNKCISSAIQEVEHFSGGVLRALESQTKPLKLGLWVGNFAETQRSLDYSGCLSIYPPHCLSIYPSISLPTCLPIPIDL